MPGNRRKFLKQACIISISSLSGTVGLLNSHDAFAEWLDDHFAPGKIDNTIERLYSGAKLVESDKIELKVPRIAENGAVVPVSVSSSLENVQSITLLADKNPVPLVATFILTPDMTPFVSARIKMAETSHVIAIVKTGDTLYMAQQQVKVTIGGCGG
ncbi:MAG: thiosulfate oxidation carrier protein SoxY [Methylomicrobium sp.]|nr:thiosulfate oxidation carrier protein SoxY [Methylomicrobium sp.]